MLKEILLTILSFSGLLAGYLLAAIAKEEVKISRRYLLKISDIIALISGAVFIYFAWLAGNTTVLATFAIGIIISLIIKKEYFYIGLLFALSIFLGNEAMLFFSSMTFLYGCVYGITVEERIKTLFVDLGIFLLPFALIGTEYIVGRYSQLVIVVCAVALGKYVVLRRSFKAIR